MTRDRLFSQLPAIWKILDQRNLTVDEQGTLERFLGAWDTELDRTQGFVEELFTTKNIDQTKDRYLYILGVMVGHRWNSNKTYHWNRNRIRDSIRRYSYKGTKENISDLVREHGGNWFKLLDMASTVAVWSRQGIVDDDNCYFFDSDFHQPGVFLLYLAEDVDIEHFLEDFKYIKPAGTKWYFYLKSTIIPATITPTASSELQPIMDLTPDNWLAVFNVSYLFPMPKGSLLVPHLMNFSEKYVYWDNEEALFDDTYDVYI